MKLEPISDGWCTTTCDHGLAPRPWHANGVVNKPFEDLYPGNAVADALKVGMVKTGMFFLDETGLLRTSRDPVFVVGLIHSREPSGLTRKIQAIRDRHHWYDEMKWSAITNSNRNLEAYRRVIEAFFESNLEQARFGCIVMRKEELDLKRFFLGNVWEAYEAFAALEVRLSLFDDEVVTVLADDMSVPAHVTFEQNLKRRVNEKKGRLAVTNVLRIDSKGCQLIQLADLLIGAVAYDFKLALGSLPAAPSAAKVEALRLIKDSVGATDFTHGHRASTTRGRKMRVRLFTPRASPTKEIAGHGPHGATPATAGNVAAPAAEVNIRPSELKGLTGTDST